MCELKKELIKEFAVKISQSNKSQLLIIVYELILISLKEADDYFEQGNIDLFMHSLRRAQGLVKELMEALDFQYPISLELLQLYLFVNRGLLQAMAKKKTEPLQGLPIVITNLKNAFEVVSKEDRSAPIMLNTQKVYAGLTYGKDSLSETYAVDRNRGYQA